MNVSATRPLLRILPIMKLTKSISVDSQNRKWRYCQNHTHNISLQWSSQYNTNWIFMKKKTGWRQSNWNRTCLKNFTRVFSFFVVAHKMLHGIESRAFNGGFFLVIPNVFISSKTNETDKLYYTIRIHFFINAVNLGFKLCRRQYKQWKQVKYKKIISSLQLFEGHLIFHNIISTFVQQKQSKKIGEI